MKFLSRIILLLTAVMITAPAASAAEDGFVSSYIGIGLGQSEEKWPGDRSDIAESNSDGMAYKVYAGLGLGDFFALETGYVQFSDVTTRFQDTTPGGTDVSYTDRYDIRALTLGINIGYDVTEHFRPFVSLGMHSWKLDITELESSPNVILDDSSVSGTDGFYGVGAEFRLGSEGVMQRLALRVEAENYLFDGGDFSEYLYTAGLLYRF